MKLGGPGIIIQIDESLFRHIPKYHRGHRPASEKWDFGMADTSKKPARICKGLVERRNAETLIPIIERVAAPGSTIWSDQWRAYCRLEKNPSYIYAAVNHSQNFVDPGTGVHTQSSESYWNVAKRCLKAMSGTTEEMLPNYLDQFMWENRYGGEDCFDNILLHIAESYPVV